MVVPFRVHLIGFSDFERGTLGSYFRLAQGRRPGYQQVVEAGRAQLLIVDADRPAALAAAAALGTPTRTIYVGAGAPQGALAVVPRPIDPGVVVRQLDAMVAAQARSLAQAAAPRPAPPAARPGPPPPTPRRRDTTALIVDDSEVAARFLEVKLHPYGLRTERVADAAAALAALAQRRFDFVFLDIELGPGSRIGGLELCQRIKRAPDRPEGTALPVVALVSAHAGSVDRVQGALAGADGHLGKPLDEGALAQWLALHGVMPTGA